MSNSSEQSCVSAVLNFSVRPFGDQPDLEIGKLIADGFAKALSEVCADGVSARSRHRTVEVGGNREVEVE
jgi:hypothetical protein